MFSTGLPAGQSVSFSSRVRLHRCLLAVSSTTNPSAAAKSSDVARGKFAQSSMNSRRCESEPSGSDSTGRHRSEAHASAVAHAAPSASASGTTCVIITGARRRCIASTSCWGTCGLGMDTLGAGVKSTYQAPLAPCLPGAVLRMFRIGRRWRILTFRTAIRSSDVTHVIRSSSTRSGCQRLPDV